MLSVAKHLLEGTQILRFAQDDSDGYGFLSFAIAR